MVNEPRTGGMVKEPRDGERIQQSVSDEQRELKDYLIRALNSNKVLRQRLGDLFHRLDAEGIDPGDIDAWVWAASMKLDAMKQLVGLMPGAEHAVIISERVNPLLERYPLLKALGGWSLIRDSYRTWHGISRLATVPLSDDLRALLRNGETQWFWEGVVGKTARGRGRESRQPNGHPGLKRPVEEKPRRGKGREKPTLLYADLWEKLGLTDDPDRERLLAAHRREWPILVEPTTVELGTDYGDFEKGGMMPRIAFTIDVDILSDPRNRAYADVMGALNELFEAARKEARRQYKAILEQGKAQGLKERPLNHKVWQDALFLYLFAVEGETMGQIEEYENVDKAQVSRSCRRAAELLGIEFA